MDLDNDDLVEFLAASFRHDERLEISGANSDAIMRRAVSSAVHGRKLIVSISTPPSGGDGAPTTGPMNKFLASLEAVADQSRKSLRVLCASAHIVLQPRYWTFFCRACPYLDAHMGLFLQADTFRVALSPADFIKTFYPAFRSLFRPFTKDTFVTYQSLRTLMLARTATWISTDGEHIALSEQARLLNCLTQAADQGKQQHHGFLCGVFTFEQKG